MTAGFGRRGIDIAATRTALVERQAAQAPKPKKGMGLLAKIGLSTVAVVAGTFGMLVILALTDDGPAVAKTESLPTRDGWTVVSTEKTPLRRPSEPQATYSVIGVAKTADGKAVAMNTRYSQQSGWTYTMRAFDCENGKLFTLGSGETFEAMQVYRPDPHWGQLIDGSSATQVAAVACNKIGKTLSGVQ